MGWETACSGKVGAWRLAPGARCLAPGAWRPKEGSCSWRPSTWSRVPGAQKMVLLLAPEHMDKGPGDLKRCLAPTYWRQVCRAPPNMVFSWRPRGFQFNNDLYKKYRI